AKRNGQDKWFDDQLKKNPDLTKQVVKAYTDTRGFLSDDDKKFEASLEPFLGPEDDPDFDGWEKKALDVLAKYDTPPATKQGQEKTDPLSALHYVPGSISQVEVKPTYQIRAEFNLTQKPGEDAGQLADRVTKNLGDIDFGQRASMTDSYAFWG
ncbi:hypothetical protein ACNAMQ_005906, partial [Escherichia coli]